MLISLGAYFFGFTTISFVCALISMTYYFLTLKLMRTTWFLIPMTVITTLIKIMVLPQTKTIFASIKYTTIAANAAYAVMNLLLLLLIYSGLGTKLIDLKEKTSSNN